MQIRYPTHYITSQDKEFNISAMIEAGAELGENVDAGAELAL
jgi:hypothetical protein